MVLHRRLLRLAFNVLGIHESIPIQMKQDAGTIFALISAHFPASFNSASAQLEISGMSIVRTNNYLLVMDSTIGGGGV